MNRDIIDIRYTRLTATFAEVEVVRDATTYQERMAGERRVFVEHLEVPARVHPVRHEGGSTEVLVDGSWRTVRPKRIPNARDWFASQDDGGRRESA